jgi:hypothetical protein
MARGNSRAASEAVGPLTGRTYYKFPGFGPNDAQIKGTGATRKDGFGGVLPTWFGPPKGVENFVSGVMNEDMIRNNLTDGRGNPKGISAADEVKSFQAQIALGNVNLSGKEDKVFDSIRQVAKLSDKLKNMQVREPEGYGDDVEKGQSFSKQDMKNLDAAQKHLEVIKKDNDAAGRPDSTAVALAAIQRIRELGDSYAKVPVTSRQVNDPGGDPTQSETSSSFDETMRGLVFMLRRSTNSAVLEWTSSKGK